MEIKKQVLTDGVQPGKQNLSIQALACSLPLIFYLLSAIVFPRPYYVTEMDLEQDYYYNARMISEGIPLNYHHPGTPIYHLGHVLLSLSGTNPNATQVFFNYGYLIIAVATALSLCFFAGLLLRGVPPGVSVLVMASIVAWPSFLAYSNYFGADSFIVAAGLPTVAFFWKSLERSDQRIPWEMILCGIGIGLCLAIKMSFLPLAAILFISYAVHVLRSVLASPSPLPRGLPARLGAFISQMASPVGGFLVSYLVFTAPIFSRLRFVWVGTFTRRDAFPPEWDMVGGVLKTLALLFSASPLFTATVVSALGIFIYLIVRQLFHGRFQRGKSLLKSGSVSHYQGFDSFSAGIFLVLMAAAFAYTAAAAVPITPGAEAGIRLRNISPCALFFPFLVLYCQRIFRESKPLGFTGHPAFSKGVLVLAAMIIFSGWILHFVDRQDFIRTHLARINEVRQRLAILPTQGERIAFWTESDQDMLGEVSFHFWGNYRYARNHFDELLLRNYPSFAFLKLRNVRHEINQSRQAKAQGNIPDASTGHSRYGTVGDLYWKLKGWLLTRPPDPGHWKIGGIISEGAQADRIAAIALPACELDEFAPLSESEAIELLRTHLGLGRSWKEKIGGFDWVFFDTPTSAIKIVIK